MFVFLVGGIVFTFAFIDEPQMLFGKPHSEIDIPTEGFSIEGKVDNLDKYIYSLHPDREIVYSLDGGDHYIHSGTQKLYAEHLQNADLMRYPTSIRWRGPCRNFPEALSLSVRLKKEGEYSSQKVYNYYDTEQCTKNVAFINIPESDLFDWNKGLMIYGKASEQDEGFNKMWWYRSANFVQRGIDWERRANFQYFEDGKLELDQDVGFRISGNASRYFPQKSFRLYARGMYDKKKFKYRFWGDYESKKHESLLFRNSGNDNEKTMFADAFIHDISRELNVAVQAAVPVTVFINGNYWGIYNLRQRVEAYTIAKKEDVKTSEVTILYCEVDGNEAKLKDGSEEVQEQYQNMIDELRNKEIDAKTYKSLAEVINVGSFIDYIILETFFGNDDWSHNNTVWYKAGDKKWKWMINDMDVSMAYPGEHHLQINLFHRMKRISSLTAVLFNALSTNNEFLERFKTRAKEVLEHELSEQRLLSVFEKHKQRYQNDIHYQINRWRMIASIKEWEANCQKNTDFLVKRRSIYLKQIEEL
ncbi:MAG: CotH kinase family protein [Crocinitomicaceae bacterium]|nr:CotH kinase family protein [Crocinitomicaceae bacterium]